MHWTSTWSSRITRLRPDDFRPPFVKTIRACGRWSCPSANTALERAARKIGRPGTELRQTGSQVADLQDLSRHTDPETTMIYAPPRLQKHAAAIERLERADRAPAAVSQAIWLAEPAGRDLGDSVSRSF